MPRSIENWKGILRFEASRQDQAARIIKDLGGYRRKVHGKRTPYLEDDTASLANAIEALLDIGRHEGM